ncbi:MAG: tRNA preQ1(34) S-adenosylmethionine ribosyltransferase-isomerase QueA [Candidatus Aureabacteria bacterium]|nr:tRNA preQ1(34) S-adenosylmethionine ribosyltransferase-isomerase QueA [Candidatus Auribacterota bacterium]
MNTYTTADFDYTLPSELIAQHPSHFREDAKILVPSMNMRIFPFRQIVDLFDENDVLILNNTQVMKARMNAVCRRTGIKHELLFVEPVDARRWDVMIKNIRRLKEGDALDLTESISVILEKKKDYFGTVITEKSIDIQRMLQKYGGVPLPPYIRRKNTDSMEEDESRYQTVYSTWIGSAAAPTAGFHFTHELLTQLKKKGVLCVDVLLHIGPGTFLPVNTAEPSSHIMHREWMELSLQTAEILNQSREKGCRLTAVGTTSIRVLETCFSHNRFHSYKGHTDLFIYPPKKVSSCDRLITNFHQPKSTLLMLVSAFSGVEFIRQIYARAIREKMRFFSYGDAVLLENYCKE